jgi:hypothetical protein
MNRLLNLGQLALALRLPRNWLEAEAEAGRIPCLQIGCRLRFNIGAVEEALVERAGKLHAVQPAKRRGRHAR